MALKTNVQAEDGRHDLTITRDFDLPVELLFRAHAEPEIVEEWMGTKVVKFDTQGEYGFETSDANGNVLFAARGVIHEFEPNRKITRTFEMANAGLDVQLEFIEFEALAPDTSRLTMHTVFRSGEHRDTLLRMPFAQGLNMAHNRLQEVAEKLI